MLSPPPDRSLSLRLPPASGSWLRSRLGAARLSLLIAAAWFLAIAACDDAEPTTPDGSIIDSSVDDTLLTDTEEDTHSSVDAEPELCETSCEERHCGDDGCGGSCGSCFGLDGRPSPELCIDGNCCLPDCAARVCGDDGCGGSCGSCFDASGHPAPEMCIGGVCCVRDCEDKDCGEDGCGGSCGECVGEELCSDEFRCEVPCEPACEGRCCGDDGCGGSCPADCVSSTVVCLPGVCTCAQVYPDCGIEHQFPSCPQPLDAPTSSAEIKAFTATNAVPLMCVLEDESTWSFDAVELDADGARVFMFGEIHGSDELGVISAALFKQLVRSGAIDAVAMEAGWDMTDAMNIYIQTGGGPLLYEYGFDYFPRTDFIYTLVKAARDLFLEGFEVRAAPVDRPWIPGWVNSEIETLAEGLVQTRALVLDTLPEAMGYYDVITMGYLGQTAAYRDHIQANLEAICAELDDSDCERLEQLANALWVTCFSNVGLDVFGYTNEFAVIREALIYYNFRTLIPALGEHVYAHMGSAHCARAPGFMSTGVDGTGAHLANEYPPTAGQVYATSPAWGEGSTILYGGALITEPPEPALLAAGLEDATGDYYFLSTSRPGEACIGNPFAEMVSWGNPAPYGNAYDAFVFVQQLTPESTEKAEMPEHVRRALAVQQKLWRAEAEARN